MFDPANQQFYTICNIVVNGFSFLTCLCVLGSYSQANYSADAHFKILVNLAASDCLLAVTGFLTYFLDREDGLYQLNIALSLIALWSSAFWSSAVSILLYKKIAKARGFDSGLFYTKCGVFWLGVCVCLPIVLIMGVFKIVGINYSLGDNRFDRNFSNNHHFTVFALLELLPLLAAMAMTLRVTIKKVQIIKEFDLSEIVDASPSKLYKYPLAQILVFVPSLICRGIYTQVAYTSLLWNTVRLFGYYIAGVVNVMVYGKSVASIEANRSVLLNAKITPIHFDHAHKVTIDDDDEEDNSRSDGEDDYHEM